MRWTIWKAEKKYWEQEKRNSLLKEIWRKLRGRQTMEEKKRVENEESNKIIIKKNDWERIKRLCKGKKV